MTKFLSQVDTQYSKIFTADTGGSYPISIGAKI